MPKNPISTQAYHDLTQSILEIIRQRGIKATTMDYVADSLRMSKRTLYEIFDNKENMVCSVMEAAEREARELHRHIFEASANVLEAMVRIMAWQRDTMKHVSPAFFRDLDAAMRKKYDRLEGKRIQEMMNVMALGVEQGVFRSDVNYTVLSRLVKVQMESLKRMEELFPPEITLLDAYDTILSSTLRSIVTPKGLEMLDKMLQHPYKLKLTTPLPDLTE